jgi:TetR/AcrR family transcriptional regulator
MNALKLETEQKIINAAYEIFIEKGLEGARMQEIADRAGINKALLHYYFRSKEHLFDAIFQDIFQRIIPQFAQILKSKTDPFEMVQVLLTFYNNFFMENPYMPQFFFHEIWQNPDRIAGAIKSQEINPDEVIGILKEKLPPFSDSEFLAQHMIANTMGMLLFPHIARPLFQRLFFNNDEISYNKFLSERTDFLLKMFEGLLEGKMGEDISKDPDDNF